MTENRRPESLLSPADVEMFIIAHRELEEAVARLCARGDALGVSGPTMTRAFTRALAFWYAGSLASAPETPDVIRALAVVLANVAAAPDLDERVEHARMILELPRRPDASR